MKRFSEYRIMWVLVFFDVPTETKIERQRHTQFRKDLLLDGFTRFQLSGTSPISEVASVTHPRTSKRSARSGVPRTQIRSRHSIGSAINQRS